MNQAGSRNDVTVAHKWHSNLALPVGCEHGAVLGDLVVQRFRDIRPDIDQPSLRENLLAIHLGGAKRVTRLHGRNREVRDVEQGSITVMPALEPNRWSTEGPVDFAHLTLSFGLLGQIAMEEFDRDPRDLQLLGVIGRRDAAIETCFNGLLSDIDRPQPGRLYRESLLVVISFNLVRHCSTLSATLPSSHPGTRSGQFSKGGLASWQIRRVIDYMQSNLAQDIGIDGELIRLTGLSRAQFFRAFSKSTGRSPHAYLSDLRVQQALRLLQVTDMPVGSIASAVGLSRTQLSDVFRRGLGRSPTAQRRLRERAS